WNDLKFYAGGLNGRDPVGYSGHACGFASHNELPHARGPSRLDIDVVLRQSRTRQQSEQRIECGILKRHHGDGLTLEVGRLLDAGILAHHELHEALATENRYHFDWNVVAAHNDGRVGHDAADRSIARTHLLGHVNATATDGITHIQSGF